MKSSMILAKLFSFWAPAIFLVFGLGACERKYGDKQEISENLEIASVQIEPDGHFHAALDAFANNEYSKSADLIKRGIDDMKAIANLVDSADRDHIYNSILELYDLQTAVYNENVDGIDELNQCFAHAGKALAGVHITETMKSFYALDGKKAGAELLKAIEAIERLEGKYRSGLDQDDLKYLEGLKEFTLELSTGRVEQKELDRRLKELSDRMMKSDLELLVKYQEVKENQTQLVPGKH
jgi:hypothetical protein